MADLQNWVDRSMMFNLDAILFDAYVIGAIVDMYAAIFGADPHGRLIAITFVGVRVLKKTRDINDRIKGILSDRVPYCVYVTVVLLRLDTPDFSLSKS